MKPSFYPVEIFYSEGDGGMIAIAPDLPGCSAFGKTRADAAREIEHAISAWLEACSLAGNPIPDPNEAAGREVEALLEASTRATDAAIDDLLIGRQPRFGIAAKKAE